MIIFLAALILVGLCVIGLCFNILFRKNGHFPDIEIESNANMKKLGIKCAKAEEMEMWRRKKGGSNPRCNGENSCSSCEDCMFYLNKMSHNT